MARVPRLLVIFFILCLGIGSSTAALACAEMPVVAAAGPMHQGCPDQPNMKKNDHAASCAFLCAALPAPSIPVMRPTSLIVSMNIAQPVQALLPWTARPETPPPRTDSFAKQQQFRTNGDLK